MRLSSETVENLIRGLEEYFSGGEGYELYLFGSRADDNKKGGDIDLLLLLSEENYLRFLPFRHRLVMALKKHIDDEKIDLTLMNPHLGQADVFYRSIKDSMILLKKR